MSSIVSRYLGSSIVSRYLGSMSSLMRDGLAGIGRIVAGTFHILTNGLRLCRPE